MAWRMYALYRVPSSLVHELKLEYRLNMICIKRNNFDKV